MDTQKEILNENKTNDEVPDGTQFVNFNHSIESLFADRIENVIIVEAKLNQEKDDFRDQCKKRYKDFLEKGDMFSLTSNYDQQILDLMMGLFAHTKAAVKQGRKNEVDQTCKQQRKSDFAITKCCGMIVRKEYYQQRKDVLHNIKDFFNESYFTPNNCQNWLVGIDKSIQSYVKFLHENKLMICIKGEPWIRWPKYSSKEATGCSCTGKNWYHGEF